MQGIFEAVREGSVMDVMWWISLKTEINCKYPDMYGTLSPLHVAVKYGRVHTVAFLALVNTNIIIILLLLTIPLNLICRMGPICMQRMKRGIHPSL